MVNNGIRFLIPSRPIPPRTMDENVKIMTIEGHGWRDTYEMKPDGTRVLINSFSTRKEPHKVEDATGCTFTREMMWSDFCKQFPNSKCVSVAK